MACNSTATHLLGGPLLMGNEVMANSFVLRATLCCSREWCISSGFSGQPWSFGINSSFFTIHRSWTRRHDWRTALALNTGGIPGDGGQDEPSDDSRVLSGTRLGRIVSAGARQLLGKLNMARKNFPMKIFLLLLGFYTANALATILGQTGDWDVIVAGVVVAAIEGLGMLVYRKPSSLPTERMQSFMVMMNYWKAGVCLGLFVDAFKLGS